MFQKEYLQFLINGVYIMHEYEVKYDVDLDLVNKNSLKLINDRISDNSLILEFGPANGRLTKHLKEIRNCKVDIIEINPVSGKDAAKYARKALIGPEDGDIESFKWLEALKNEKYDYVLFADVLEHLRSPEEVLDKCRILLKETGAILFSVPNIANNNIILNLLKDEFNYTPTGLLDDTHIHFFSYNSLNKLMNKLGYFVSYIDGTKGKVGETEIKVNYDEFSSFNTDLIKKHKLGEVYQYIYELRLDDRYRKINNIDIEYLKNNLPLYEPHCFLFINNEYTEKNKLSYSSIKCLEDKIVAKFDLKNRKTEGKLRIDPLEGQFCSCEIVSIETDAEDYHITRSNAYSIDGNKYTFFTIDPVIEILGDFSNTTYITITYKLEGLCSSEIENIASKLRNQVIQANNEVKEAIIERDNLIREINAIKSTVEYKLLKKIRKILHRNGS